MSSPTVIIDLSPVVRLDDINDWRQVEAVVKAWREQRDPKAVFYGIADNSLWYLMDDYGQRRLNEWKRRAMARSISFADPEILLLAEENPGATIITTDLFRDHRVKHPWLQGSDRLVKPVIRGNDVKFVTLDFSPIRDHEVSLRAEEADLKPKGITTPAARQALLSEWACTNPDCVWGRERIIDDDPSYRNDQVCCPTCGAIARNAGARENTREMVILLGGHVVDRVPLADGTEITIGRGRGTSRYDVRGLLDDPEAALVSRDHLRLSNKGGRLLVEDLASKNGTTLVRSSGDASPLQPAILQTLQPTDHISLANGALKMRPSGRKRARGKYAPDLTTPPWRHDSGTETD